MNGFSQKFVAHSLGLCIAGTLHAQAQGTFQNLGFELATLTNVSPGQIAFVPFNNAFPGWTGYWGTNPAPLAIYNGVSIGSVQISLIGRSSPEYSNNVIVGNYSAALSAGSYENDPIYQPAAIAQVGTIPATAQSLRFRAQPLLGNIGNLAVTLDGQAIPFYALGTGPNYVSYGADISAFAGLTRELRFSEHPISGPTPTVFLDVIAFSDSPIPEPGPCGLFVFGALLVGCRLLRKQSGVAPVLE